MDRTAALLALDKTRLWHPFTQMENWLAEDQLVIERGEGAYLFDTDGQRYLDGVSSLWVNLHGHNRPEINAAITAQLGKIAHSTQLGLTSVPAIELSDALVCIAPPGLARVFYSDSGSTAVEIALKIAYQYQQQNGRPQRKKFLRFVNAYHGDTLGSVSVGGMDLFHGIYGGLLFETIAVPYPDLFHEAHEGETADAYYARCLADATAVIRAHGSEAAALVVEPLVQGAAGMHLMPADFFKELFRLAREEGMLFIADEVAVGFGRTGTMFACEQAGITPDLLCLAKGISGGYLPLAATLATEEIFNGFLGAFDAKRTFYHGHSYTGNQLACAAGLASLSLFTTDHTLANVAANIDLLTRKLPALLDSPHVGDVRRCGVMVGIELVESKKPRRFYDYGARTGHRVSMACRPKGLIIRPLGDVLVLLPPLSVTQSQIEETLSIIRAAIDEVCGR